MAQTQVAIPEKIFFKIGEVCDIVEVQAHVLRYWETEFPMLSPQKNRSGQRTYRRKDVEIALQIKDLLYEDLYTIAGAKKRLQNESKENRGLKIVHSDKQKSKSYIKPVEEISSIEETELEIEDTELESPREVEVSKADNAGFDAEKRDALKSLASQLLELRQILKTDQTAESKRHISKY